MDIYNSIFYLGICMGMILSYFFDVFLKAIIKNPYHQFLGEQKLLNKYYEWKKYNK